MNTIDKTIQHIVDLQYRLCQVENNLQYIGLMVSLKKSLEKFYGLFKNEKEQQELYLSTYHYYFYDGCGHSLYDRVSNSIIEYRNGKRPFDNVH